MAYTKLQLGRDELDEISDAVDWALSRDDASVSLSYATDAPNLVFVVVRLSGNPTLTVMYDSNKQRIFKVRPCSSVTGSRLKEAREQAAMLLQDMSELEKELQLRVPRMGVAEGCLFADSVSGGD